MGAMTSRLVRRAGWAAAGALAVAVVLAAAGVVRGGPLDPPGPPNSTLQPLNQMPPDWYAALASNNGDGNGCGSSRFDCVMFERRSATQPVTSRSTACSTTRRGSCGSATSRARCPRGRERRTPARTSPAAARKGGGCRPRRKWRASRTPASVTPSFALPAGHPFRTIPSGPIVFWTTTRDATNTQNIYTVRFRGVLQGDGPLRGPHRCEHAVRRRALVRARGGLG